MPHIIFTNGNYAEDSNKLKKLNEDLSIAIESPADWFTFTFLSSDTKTYQLGKNISDNTVFVEIKWFSRPQNLKEDVANIIGDFLKSFPIDSKEIIIIFSDLTRENYFEV